MTTLRQIHKILTEGEFPSKTVVVKNVPFTFAFTDQLIPTKKLDTQVKFLAKTVSFKGISGTQFIEELPIPLFYAIVEAYARYQFTQGKYFLDILDKYVESAESRGLWAVYTHASPENVLALRNNKLNAIQQRWIALNTIQDNRNKTELISSVFDALKPWLDKELYARMREHQKDTRENAFYNDEQFDQKLRDKAKKAAQNVSKEDLDIVYIEKHNKDLNNNGET